MYCINAVLSRIENRMVPSQLVVLTTELQVQYYYSVIIQGMEVSFMGENSIFYRIKSMNSPSTKSRLFVLDRPGLACSVFILVCPIPSFSFKFLFFLLCIFFWCTFGPYILFCFFRSFFWFLAPSPRFLFFSYIHSSISFSPLSGFSCYILLHIDYPSPTSPILFFSPSYFTVLLLLLLFFLFVFFVSCLWQQQIKLHCRENLLKAVYR